MAIPDREGGGLQRAGQGFTYAVLLLGGRVGARRLRPAAPCSPAYWFAKQGSWLSLFPWLPWLPWLPCGIDMSRAE